MKPGQWAERQKTRRKIREQSEVIADRLEAAGIAARQNTGMTMLTAVTDVRTDQLAFRPSRMIPEVAVRERRGVLNALTYYLDEIYDRPDLVRYGVVTTSELVPAFGDLRGPIQDLQRAVSKWSDACDDRWDVEVIFRSTEFTRATARERHEKSGLMVATALATPGLVLYHPHANVLYRPRSKMSPEKWTSFLRWTAEFFGAHWKDCGRIEDLREIVKYVCKPDELLAGESPIEPDETAWLYHQLYKLRQTAPMRSFKDWWSELKADRCKIVTRNAGDVTEYVIAQKSRRLNHTKNDELATSTADPGTPGQPEADKNRDVTKRECFGEAENVFLGVTLPQHSATPWAEPVLLIHNYNPRPMSQSSIDRLQEIRHEQAYWRSKWNEKGAPAPETALLIAREWEQAGRASNVVAFAPEALEDRTEALLAADAERRNYRVHKSSVTVREHRSSTRGIPPDPPPERVPLIKLDEGESIATAVEKALGVEKSDVDVRGAPVIDIWS